MLEQIFEAHNKKYMFSKIVNLWGDEEIGLYENSDLIGYLNEKYSVEEAIKLITAHQEFKKVRCYSLILLFPYYVMVDIKKATTQVIAHLVNRIIY